MSVERDGKVIVGLGVGRSQLERATEASGGLLQTLLVLQDVSQVVVGLAREGSSASACRR